MFRGQFRRRMRAIFTGITVLAVTGLVWAPGGSASQAPATEPRQDSVEVIGGTISFSQGTVFGSTPPKFDWGVDRQVSLVLPGDWEGGESVETRFIPEGSKPTRWWTQYVKPGGEATVRPYPGPRGTLKKVKKQARKLNRPTTVEIRLPSGGPVLSAQVGTWTTIPLLLLRNVKMTQRGQSIKFTGVLVDEKGKPVSAGFVGIAPLATSGGRPPDIGPLLPVPANGRFVLESSTPPQSDYVAVTWGGLSALDPDDITAPRHQAGPVYSTVFKYRR